MESGRSSDCFFSRYLCLVSSQGYGQWSLYRFDWKRIDSRDTGLLCAGNQKSCCSFLRISPESSEKFFFHAAFLHKILKPQGLYSIFGSRILNTSHRSQEDPSRLKSRQPGYWRLNPVQQSGGSPVLNPEEFPCIRLPPRSLRFWNNSNELDFGSVNLCRNIKVCPKKMDQPLL